jgi:hypothetical protein
MCRKARGPPSEQTKAKRAATRRENSWAKARKSSGATPLNFGVEPPPVSALPIARGAAGATPVDGSYEATSGSGDPTVATAPVQQGGWTDDLPQIARLPPLVSRNMAEE